MCSTERFLVCFQQPISVVPQTFGYTLPPLNAGVNSNRGFDIMLTHKNRINDDLSYNVNAMFSWNRGRYDKNITDQLFDISTLDPDDYASEDDYQTAVDFYEQSNFLNRREGQWTNRYFGYVSDGYFNLKTKLIITS